MKTSQYLRFVPTKPVIFTYYGKGCSDEVPTVLVVSLLHSEENPGFMGINLNYVTSNKADLINLFSYRGTISKEDFNSKVTQLAPDCLRRYNYGSIGRFIYRGSKQNHD